MMAQSTKYYRGVVGLLCMAAGTLSQAESDIQVGLVGSANSTFYKQMDQEYYLLPLVIAEYDRFYLQGISGGYRLIEFEEGHSLALEVRHTFDGYSSDDSDFLKGMADRDPAWEMGLAYELNLAGGQMKTQLMQDISNTHKGFSARIEYERPYWTSDDLMLSWYTGSEYWNEKKSDYYFGVTAAEANATRSEYRADQTHSLFVGTNAFKQISENLRLIFSAEYLQESDSVDQSPLTEERDQWSTYAGIFYQF